MVNTFFVPWRSVLSRHKCKIGPYGMNRNRGQGFRDTMFLLRLFGIIASIFMIYYLASICYLEIHKINMENLTTICKWSLRCYCQLYFYFSILRLFEHDRIIVVGTYKNLN